MSAVAAPIDVLRQAMILLGHQAPQTLADQNPNAVAFNAIYETLVQAELQKPNWRFSTKTGALVFQGETDIGPRYQYVMPSDVLTPRYLMVNRYEFRDYEVMGRKILVHQKRDYEIVYVYRAEEGEWPADFSEALTMIVASRLPFGSRDRKRELAQEGEFKMTQASARDANRGVGRLQETDSRLVNAWLNRKAPAHARPV